MVVGAGIAGASAAAEIALHCRVVLVEAEQQPGYHATGRSAAFFATGYGNRAVRSVTAAGEGFFRSPPAEFTSVQLLKPRDCLYLARADQMASLDQLREELGEQARRIDQDALCLRVPVVRRDYAAAGVLVSGGGDLDVDALLQGYLRQVKRRRGKLINGAQVTAIEPREQRWRLKTSRGSFEAPVVVNAAGAWADQVAALAGVAGLGIEPRRRTACLIDGPANIDVSDWPLVIDADEQFYFKPDAGALLLSPADETASGPCDAQPEEVDVALAVDRFERATTLEVKRVRAKWAGLRSFATDRTPVVGFDPRTHGFFWLAGQGGYGVQTAPGLSQLAAHLIAAAPLTGQYGGLMTLLDELAPERLFKA